MFFCSFVGNYISPHSYIYYMNQIIKKYRELPLDKLALMLASQHEPDATHILQQVEGWQRLRHKVPLWAETEGIEYPHRLALEQCSGQAAAEYKAQVVKRLFADADDATKLTMVDLTGGLGVDFSFVAKTFDKATYVERQEELYQLAQHNFPLLGLDKAEVVHGDGVDFLQKMPTTDLIFLDPARRDGAGRKTVLIEDCEPDVCALRETLLSKARFVVVKLSPMLDIAASVRSLGCVSEVHVVSSGGECKDLLLVLSKNGGNNPNIYVNENGRTLHFNAAEEADCTPQMAQAVGNYLYEPGPAVLKAGAFKWTAVHFGLKKLHVNSHLYTSDEHVDDFPGRTFEVEKVMGFGKNDLKQLRQEVTKANITVRNFPSSVDALRKKLKIKEGGDVFIFATTMTDNQHVMIICKKKSLRKMHFTL